MASKMRDEPRASREGRLPPYTLFLLFFLFGRAVANLCYSPDGMSWSENQMLPCANDDGALSQQCCYTGDACLDNQLCYRTVNHHNIDSYYRSTCSDKHWGPGCPNYCLGGNGTDGGIWPVVQCPDVDEWWACETNPPRDFRSCFGLDKIFSVDSK